MDAFRKEKIILRAMGVNLPGEIHWPWLKTSVNFYFCFQVGAVTLWCGLLVRAFCLYLHDNFLERMIGLSAAVSILGTITKLVTLKINSPLLKELFESMQDFVADTKRGKLVRKFVFIYKWATAAIIITHNYEYFAYSEPTRQAPYYTKYQTGGSRWEVAVDFWFIFYSAVITILGNVIADTLFLLFTNQLCHRLFLLAGNVSLIGKDSKQMKNTKGIMEIGSDEENIRKCVEEHVRLIRMKNKLEHLYNYIILIQLVYSFLTICLSLFTISQFNNAYLVLQEIGPQIISLFLEIFLYCWAGQMIHNHFEDLRLAVYNSAWYNCKTQDSSSILIMQIYTTAPVDVTSVSVFHLNYQLYETICRETFSYYTIMSQLFSQ